MASSNMGRWSGVVFESKNETKIKKYPNLTVIPDSSEINGSSKHARGCGKDSKHATSKEPTGGKGEVGGWG